MIPLQLHYTYRLLFFVTHVHYILYSIITCKHKMLVPGPKRSLTTDCDEPESKQVPSSDTLSHTVTDFIYEDFFFRPHETLAL